MEQEVRKDMEIIEESAPSEEVQIDEAPAEESVEAEPSEESEVEGSFNA